MRFARTKAIWGGLLVLAGAIAACSYLHSPTENESQVRVAASVSRKAAPSIMDASSGARSSRPVGQLSFSIEQKDPASIEQKDPASPATTKATGRSVHVSQRSKLHDYPFSAVATRFKSAIYSSPFGNRQYVGYVRQGGKIRVKRPVAGSGCKGGKWYPTSGGGYICSQKGFKVSKSSGRSKEPPASTEFKSKDLPYLYAKVINDGALRLQRLPTARESLLLERAIKRKSGYPSIVQKRMVGIYFVALNGLLGEAAYVRTIRGRYVLARDIRPVSPPAMRGERLQDSRVLPLAFVYGEDRPRYREARSGLERQGLVKNQERFKVLRTIDREKRYFVEGPEGLLVEREGVRIARRVARPEAVPSGAKWIHVDLAEQTLVAYEGDTPVYATLVSSGKEGHETPTGVYRIIEKHVTDTMRGKDPVDGWYEVGEVPWTMFYRKYYAIHGAYWHNAFGQTRSHGCTNLAPADARWLFHWSDPKLPDGWYGQVHGGTWISFTS